MKDKDDPNTLGSEWMVVDCPHCKREVRIRARSRLSQLACPYCSNPLGEDNNPHPALTAPTRESASQAHSQRHRKVSSKSKPFWDETPDESQEHAQDDLTAEFLEADPNNENQVRIRRVRRKIHLRPWQKVRRIIFFAMLAIIGIAGITLFMTLVFKGGSTVTADLQNPIDIEPKATQELTPDQKTDHPIPASLTRGERDYCLQMIHAFSAAKTVEKKLALVANPEITG